MRQASAGGEGCGEGELSGGTTGEGKPAMISAVAQGAGLDPERKPDDRALTERLAAELVELGSA